MPKLPDVGTDPIEFLLRRRFPYYAEIVGELESWRYGEKPAVTADFNEKLAKIRSARSELEALSDDDLHAEVLAEIEAARQERQAREDAEEQMRFFNQPSAAARVDHWSRLPLWKLDEAIALTFGKDPSLVNSIVISAAPRSSVFVKRYFDLKQIIKRAVQARQLADP